MHPERRTFERTDSTSDGELQWQIKRRTGGIKTIRLGISTVDLSIDGARVMTAKRAKLPVGASVLISFGGHESPARVRALLPDPMGSPRQQLLLLQFEEPSPDFLREVDRLLDESNGASAYKSAHWDNVRADEYGEAEHAKAERGAPARKPAIRI